MGRDKKEHSRPALRAQGSRVLLNFANAILRSLNTKAINGHEEPCYEMTRCRDGRLRSGRSTPTFSKAIRDLNCSSVFRQSNFGFSKYEGDNGHEEPCTRDGFTRLVMSFTGEKVASGRAAVRP
jgi:hypothetical protein